MFHFRKKDVFKKYVEMQVALKMRAIINTYK